MKISELIELLQERQRAIGDCEVAIVTNEGERVVRVVNSKIKGTDLVVTLDTEEERLLKARPMSEV